VAEANAYKAITVANALKDAAPKVSEAVQLEGSAEAKL